MALQVLTNRELFRCVASWMPGWPVALDEFVLQRVIAPANSGRRGKKRMATDMRRRLMLRALGGRTLPMAIVQELRHADDEQHALHLLAMVHDLALQSATLRTKDSLSFEHALSHALLHGARGPVVQWLLDMQPYTRPRRPTDDRTNDSGDDTDGNDKRDDEWTALWCDAIEGFADDVRTLDALRARMFVDLSASASSLDQAREALRVRSEPSLVLLQWCRAAWPQLKVPFEVVDAAAALGKQDVVSWLCDDEHSERFSSRALQNALQYHHYDTFVYLLGRCEDAVQTTSIKTVAETVTSVETMTGTRAMTAIDNETGRGNETQTQTIVTQTRHESASDQTTTVAMVDGAAADGDLALVRALHELAPVVACTTAAMDAAAARGHLQVVEYLHARRSEGCTTDAMNGAAASGHLNVVRFLHENRSEGCTTRAVDDATANGHVDVVRFLLTHRTEGGTSEAMDKAAANGHVDVLTYLHETGRVRCTWRAWSETSSREVVAFLRRHYMEELTASGLANLLLHGMFDEWKELRVVVCDGKNGDNSDGGTSDNSSRSGSGSGSGSGSSATTSTTTTTNDGAQEAMVRAGRERRPSVIRFLTRDMGRHDLEPRAMDGAAELQSIGWLYMIHEIMGDGCHFSAVVKAIDADTALPKRAEASRVRESVTCVLFLASICKDASVADAVAYALSVRNSGLASELEEMKEMEVDMTLVDPIFRVPEMPDWVIQTHDIVRHLQAPYYVETPMGPWNSCRGDPWSRLACYKGDLEALRLLHQIGHSSEFAPDTMDIKDSDHAIAARGGHLHILKWLQAMGSAFPPLNELLGIAAMNGRINVATWIVSQLPEDFVFDSVLFYCYLDVSGMSAAAIDWFATTPCMQPLFDRLTFARRAAALGCIDVLRALHQQDPTVLGRNDDPEYTVIGQAVAHGQLSTIDCLVIELRVDVQQITFSNVQDAAEGGHLETLRALQVARPDLFATSEHLQSMLDRAALHGQIQVVEQLLRLADARERGILDTAAALEPAKAFEMRARSDGSWSPPHLGHVCHTLGLYPFLQNTV
ncbi:hypothetical protein PINS_up002586 [Pythium insidiosum]|nr:hypothetical protein PINS_up002586 [Pythium insidiosum]